jgi:hypothetical protein
MKTEHEIVLPLDERNLAHVLAALALAGVAAEETGGDGKARCWWCRDGFGLRLALDQSTLFQGADTMLRSLRWVEGLGVDEKLNVAPKAHHGVLQRSNAVGTNPFLSLATAGTESSLLKTFAGQLGPRKIIAAQLGCLLSPSAKLDWLRQRAFGVASWGFDSSVGSHAYDLGFSSNDEGSGNADPIYPAIELLSLTGAALFSTPHVWQTDEESLRYVIWRDRLALALAPLAAAGCIEGLAEDRYALATRGAAYGKGAAYHYFPEASLITKYKSL